MAKHTVKMGGISTGLRKSIVFSKPLRNDQLKRSTALQMEEAKIEFKII